jgi:endonuclease-3
MSTKNRGDRIQLLQKVVAKHFKPIDPPDDRSVLEHMLYACCLEDAPYDDADEAFHRLQESYFDWNEVRVTTVSELCEVLHNLPEPATAALRIKKNLQSLFETRYSYDLDDMIKMNLGKAVQELEKLGGMTKFVLGYLTQNALGGHAIPVSNSIMDILLATEIVSDSEAEKGQAPGLERTVPKTKGRSFASELHQLAVALILSPGNKQLKAILKEAGGTETKRVPQSKKPNTASAPSQPPAESSAADNKKAPPTDNKATASEKKSVADKKKPPAKLAEGVKAAPKKGSDKKESEVKKAPVDKKGPADKKGDGEKKSAPKPAPPSPKKVGTKSTGKSNSSKSPAKGSSTKKGPATKGAKRKPR